MSCPSTTSSQTTQLNVSMGSLPEGFCPSSYQQFANVIAQRLIVTSGQSFSTFVTGSQPPTSNVGPWLKNCEEWFIFDDATATYVPITKGGFNTMQVLSSSGTFVVPSFIYKLKIEAWGGGGGGSNNGASHGPGGGGGAYGMIIRNVTPGQNIAYSIGAGGANGASGSPGGATTMLGMSAGGGSGGAVPATNSTGQGAGGTVSGADFGISGSPGDAPAANVGGFGGNAGGGGGGGGTGNSADTTVNGQVPGGGGAGGTSGGTGVGGSGGAGRIIVWY